MSEFFQRVAPDSAVGFERLSRLMYELRENRQRLLGAYAASDEAALLARIRQGEVAEHPAYEHYLGARVLGQAHAVARAELAQLAAAEQRQ
jgi:hypothetical protein